MLKTLRVATDGRAPLTLILSRGLRHRRVC